MDNTEATPTGVGRRDLIKKGAVAGAIAWTAPAIVSSKVGASGGGTCPDIDCRYYYLVKIDAEASKTKPAGHCEDSFPDNEGFGQGTDFDCTKQYNALLGQHGIGTVGLGGCQFVTVTSVSTTHLSIKLAPGFDVKFALRKQQNGCKGTCGFSRGDCDSNGKRSFSFGCGEYSNLIIVICGPVPPGGQISARSALYEVNDGEVAPLSEPVQTDPAPQTETTEATTTTTEAAQEPAPAQPVVEETTTTAATTTTTEATTTTTAAPAPIEPPPAPVDGATSP